MDHASDVVSLLTATSTNGGGESQPKEFCFFLAVEVFRASAVYQRRGTNKSLKNKNPTQALETKGL
tara:strand:- start:208 stop:405 length:198 start_codon:yes stop_codon:yes gene_type:complete